MTAPLNPSCPPTTVQFPSSDGLQLEADLYPGQSHWLLLFHGKAYHKEIWKDQLLAGLSSADLTMLAVNFRGYGQSQAGAPDYDQDVLAALHYAWAKGASTVTALGASMGGTALLQAMTSMEAMLDGVILLSPAGQPKDLALLGGKAKKGLLLYSEEEAYAENCQRVRQGLPFPLEVHTWPGNLHAHQLLADPITGPQVRSVILGFLEA